MTESDIKAIKGLLDVLNDCSFINISVTKAVEHSIKLQVAGKVIQRMSESEVKAPPIKEDKPKKKSKPNKAEVKKNG